MKIALIAHDKKKEEIIELAKKYKDILAKYELYATGTTGTMIMGETGLSIHRMKSGPKGGDQQIGAMLANGELGLIIFLRDPLTAQPHEPDVSGSFVFATYRRSRLQPTQAVVSLCLSP